MLDFLYTLKYSLENERLITTTVLLIYEIIKGCNNTVLSYVAKIEKNIFILIKKEHNELFIFTILYLTRNINVSLSFEQFVYKYSEQLV